MDTPAIPSAVPPPQTHRAVRSSPCSCCRVAARAALFAYRAAARRSWRDADWSSTGSLPAADADPEARVLVMSGRTGGWKGVFAVH